MLGMMILRVSSFQTAEFGQNVVVDLHMKATSADDTHRFSDSHRNDLCCECNLEELLARHDRPQVEVAGCSN